MLKKGFLKPKISRKTIGSINFWLGIGIGVVVAFVLCFVFSYSRELLRVFTLMADPHMPTENESILYDLFFAAFSLSIGFGFTMVFWLSGRKRYVRKPYLMTLAISNAMLVVFVSLMVVVRFGSVLLFVLYGTPGYDGDLDLLNDFWIILVLLPICSFLVQWNTISLVFRTKFWRNWSIAFYLLLTLLLLILSPADRTIINGIINTQTKYQVDYIDQEFDKARNHTIFFNDATKEILRKRNVPRTLDVVKSLKHAFETDGTVPLDTIILEKIVIHNMKRHGLSLYARREKDRNWSYALPEDIYKQILMHDVNSVATSELFEILAEQAAIFTAKRITWAERQHYTVREQDLAYFKMRLLMTTETIQSRLIQVIDKLKSDEQYQQYHGMLVDIEFDDFQGWQKHHELDLTNTDLE